MLDAFVAPAFAAYGDISVIATDFHLFSFRDYLAMGIDTGIDYCLAATGTGRLDLIDAVGNLEQPSGTLEKVGLEICT